MKTILLWDFPTRLFHWLLVAAIAGAYFTGETGGNWLVWHGRLGLLIVGLITFRIVWGFIGSTYARFTSFVRGPTAIKAYFAGQWHGLGHNPLGALSVLGLIALISLQFTTGLLATNDDTGFSGPFYSLISSQLGSLATRLHHKAFDVLAVLVGLHVAAIMYYGHVKKDNLVKPMITGRKQVGSGESARGGGLPAFIVALAIALGAVFAASGEWIEKPPQVSQEAPTW